MALAGAGDVDLVARGEHIDLHLVAHVVGGAVLKAQLAQLAAGGYVRLGEVALHGLVDELLGAVLGVGVKAHLNRLVAVLFDRLLLDNRAGTRLNDSDREQAAVLGKDLRHADLLADDTFLHDILPPDHSLISISTPAGRSSFSIASKVARVGF